MPPRVLPGPVQEDACIREAVCVHTRKIYDSCKDKDCIDDLRVYPTVNSLALLDGTVSIRPKSAELLYVTTDVEEVSFNRGFYTVDMRFFYKITGDAYTLANKYTEFSGLAIFDKRVILFGSEGNAKIFSSDTILGGLDCQSLANTNLPTAVVEAVDPIILSLRLVDNCTPCPAPDGEVFEIPQFIARTFDSAITSEMNGRKLVVTLGQFSIVRLERDTQLLIPSYDYCMPEKECVGSSDDDPCSLFSKINFPVDEFFPPDTVSSPECYRDALQINNR